MKHWFECSQKERIKRWENAARVLKALTPHQRRRHWDMDFWTRTTDCGTIACAAGHCGMDPWFRKRGFKMGPVSKGSFAEDWSNPDDFFGDRGSAKIFYNDTRRPVSKVIREVEAYIKLLKDLESDSDDEAS